MVVDLTPASALLGSCGTLLRFIQARYMVVVLARLSMDCCRRFSDRVTISLVHMSKVS